MTSSTFLRGLNDIAGHYRLQDKAGFHLVGLPCFAFQQQRMGVVTRCKSMALSLLVPLSHICPSIQHLNSKK